MANFKDAQGILDEVRSRTASFGVPCGKHSGAVTIEVLREELLRRGFPVSARDVFIRGVPVEWDLLLHRPGAIPDLGIVFAPTDVLAVLEVKNAGGFGEETIRTTNRTFSKLHAVAPEVACAYIALAELHNYRWAITTENLGFPAFTLFSHRSSQGIKSFTSTGQWPDFIRFLEDSCSR